MEGGGDFLDLFLEKPLERNAGDVVVRLKRHVIDAVDRLGHFYFLFERKFHGVLGEFEIGQGSFDGGNGDPVTGIENEAHETMGMAPFLRRLFIEMVGQTGKRVKIEISANGVVLERSGQFHSDLAVDGVDDFLGDEHGKSIGRV